MKTALAILIIMLAPSFCLAQAVKKTSVAVTHTGADQVGQSVAFNLKEAIRGSQSFTLVDHEGSPRTPRIVVRLTTIDDEVVASRQGIVSAISAAIVYDNSSAAGMGILLQTSSRSGAAEYLRENWLLLWKTL